MKYDSVLGVRHLKFDKKDGSTSVSVLVYIADDNTGNDPRNWGYSSDCVFVSSKSAIYDDCCKLKKGDKCKFIFEKGGQYPTDIIIEEGKK